MGFTCPLGCGSLGINLQRIDYTFVPRWCYQLAASKSPEWHGVCQNNGMANARIEWISSQYLRRPKWHIMVAVNDTVHAVSPTSHQIRTKHATGCLVIFILMSHHSHASDIGCDPVVEPWRIYRHTLTLVNMTSFLSVGMTCFGLFITCINGNRSN